jgi:hypothetical protein
MASFTRGLPYSTSSDYYWATLSQLVLFLVIIYVIAMAVIETRHRKRKKKVAVALSLTIGPVSALTLTFPGVKKMATLVLTDEQKCSLAIAAVDAAGNPAVLAAVPVWASSNPTVLSVVAAADGMSAEITAAGPLGASQVSVSADPGGGAAPITGTLDVTVTASAAVAFTITPGAPTAK